LLTLHALGLLSFYPLWLTTLDSRGLFPTFYPLGLATFYARRLFATLHALWLTTFYARRLFATLYPLRLTTLDTVVFRIAAIIHNPGISLRMPPLDSILTNVAIVAEPVIEAIIGSADIVVAAGITRFIAVELTRCEAAVIILANLRAIY
jgi:hypothetical protein